jgi:branched-chain amino acid transport system permease protein
VILIEHHMDVVMNLCDTVSVLDFEDRRQTTDVQADEKK